MAAKRNTKANDAEAQAAAAAAAEAEKAENAQTDEQANAPVDPDLGKTSDSVAEKKSEPINADEMATAVKVGGNSYQQYARQMFKEGLEESR